MKRNYSKLNLWGLVLISALKLNTATFGQTAPLVVTADKLHGYPGIVNGPSVFTSGTGSHSGKPGDFGIDFGTSDAGTSVHVTNATFLNIAATNPEQEYEHAERKQLLTSLLRLLPEPQRAALLLREQEEMSYAQIARVLNVSESKVKADIHRARMRLRAEWNEIFSPRAAIK